MGTLLIKPAELLLFSTGADSKGLLVEEVAHPADTQTTP